MYYSKCIHIHTNTYQTHTTTHTTNTYNNTHNKYTTHTTNTKHTHIQQIYTTKTYTHTVSYIYLTINIFKILYDTVKRSEIIKQLKNSGESSQKTNAGDMEIYN